jgi:ADP-ribosylglycohydrolase
MASHKPQPYRSLGNGSAMRCSSAGWLAHTEDECIKMATETAIPTHNHPEGIKGAQATALCIFMARHGASADDIRKRISQEFGYDLTLSVDEIRPRYSWAGLDGNGDAGTCQGSVPQAIICALEATSFEDAVRNAVSIGGDSDTIGCITGSIAEALFGIPEDIRQKGLSYLPDVLKLKVESFENVRNRF